MRNILLIAGKEFKSYLASPMAYIVAAVFVALTGGLFVQYLSQTQYGDTSLAGYMGLMGNLALILFAVVITMRLIAEEKKLGTWELLLTAPVKDTEVVLGKFLGSLGILVAMLAITLYFPLMLAVFGDPDGGPILTGYIGLLLLGSAALAIGLFASSVTSNQIVSAVIAGGILVVLYFIGMASNVTSGPVQDLLAYISLSQHFEGLARGIIDTRAIVYYLSITALFLFLTVRSLETGRLG